MGPEEKRAVCADASKTAADAGDAFAKTGRQRRNSDFAQCGDSCFRKAPAARIERMDAPRRAWGRIGKFADEESGSKGGVPGCHLMTAMAIVLATIRARPASERFV